jgi:hypothetical protein
MTESILRALGTAFAMAGVLMSYGSEHLGPVSSGRGIR